MQLSSVTRIGRVLRKPPKIILERMLSEINVQTDRFRAPRRACAFDVNVLLTHTETASLGELWAQLSRRIFAIPVRRVSERDYERVCPNDGERIFKAAAAALEHRIDLLGTEPGRSRLADRLAHATSRPGSRGRRSSCATSTTRISDVRAT